MSDSTLTVSAELIDEGVQFSCNAPGKSAVIVDYIPPHGGGRGHTSLELLLISLATCLASTVKLMLVHHAKVRVDSVHAQASGERRSEHPTTFESIELILDVESPDLDRPTLDAVAEKAERDICPVLASIDSKIPISIECRLKSTQLSA